jgi:hypothetical protein
LKYWNGPPVKAEGAAKRIHWLLGCNEQVTPSAAFSASRPRVAPNSALTDVARWAEIAWLSALRSSLGQLPIRQHRGSFQYFNSLLKDWAFH